MNSSIIKKDFKSKDRIFKGLMYVTAMITLAITAGIIAYVLVKGLPHISMSFIVGQYSPLDESKNGIMAMIINTLLVVAITLAIALPTGVCGAIYLTEYAKKGKLVNLINFTSQVLAGIPSIIFGLFGYSLFCILFNLKTSILSGALTMAVCILPTIITTTQEALKSVPSSYKEGAIALGAGKFRTIKDLVLPSAMPGIITGIILAIGRIVGESAALLFTAGLGFNMPTSGEHIFESGRTLTLHLYSLAMDSSSEGAMNMAFATGAVLLIIVFALNRLAATFAKRINKHKG